MSTTPCFDCCGAGGAFVDAAGDRHLADPEGLLADAWERCPACRGTGVHVEPVPAACVRCRRINLVDPREGFVCAFCGEGPGR